MMTCTAPHPVTPACCLAPRPRRLSLEEQIRCNPDVCAELGAEALVMNVPLGSMLMVQYTAGGPATARTTGTGTKKAAAPAVKGSGVMADRIEVSTAALRGGRTSPTTGAWEPYGQVICHLYVREPGCVEEVAARLRAAPAIDGEGWHVEVQGRVEIPLD